MGLRPWEANGMTPGEIAVMERGHKRYIEELWDIAAWVVANIRMMHEKRPPKPDELIAWRRIYRYSIARRSVQAEMLPKEEDEES